MPSKKRTSSRRVLVATVLIAVLCAACASGSSARDAVERREGPMQHYRLAVMYFDQGQVSRAIEEVDRAIKLDSDLPAATYYRGYIYWSLGNFAEAEKSFRDTVRINPLHLDARMYLASCLDQTGRSAEAIEQLDAALAIPGAANLEQVRVNKALILERQGRLGDALQELREAVTTRPRYHRAHYEMAEILRELGRFDEALSSLRAAEPGYEKNAEFHYRLGALLLRLERAQEASRSLQRAVDLGPGTDAAERARELLKVIG